MWSAYFSPWVYPLLMAIYAVSVVSCIVIVLGEKRNPIKSLAWVIALIFLPYVGLVFYIFFGRSLRSHRLISRHNKRKLLSRQRSVPLRDFSASLTPLSRSLARLATAMCGSSLMQATSLDTFLYGKEKFNALERDLQAASRSICLQYYIFSCDALGRRIASILMEKARQGLQVRVLYDHVGSFSAPSRFFTKMRRAGVQAHPFFRVTFPQLANRINWRNHRKIVVIDERIAYIGGMNIASRYVEGEAPGRPWRDTHLRLTGPVVTSLLTSFAVDWNFLQRHQEIEPIEPMPEPGPQEPSIPAQLITSGPTDRWASIAYLFQRAILSAQKRVYIQTPYFLPTDVLLKALQTAALTGVDVRVMLPERPDSRLLRYASFSYITECLQAGIKVYLYEPGMLHAKMMLVDEEFCTAGSTNFDFRSFEHNFEGNLLIYDRGVCRRFAEQYFEDIGRCRKLTLHTWTRRPRALRTGESLARLVSPIL